MTQVKLWLSVSAVISLGVLLSYPVISQESTSKVVEEIDNPGGIGGQHSLRGLTNIEDLRPANKFKDYPSQHEVSVSYVFQPPLVPHDVRNYKINLNTNKCMTCHSWKSSEKSGATRISVTHYMDRENAVLADMAPRRYFCMQCHVPQIEEPPLIDNNFKPVDSLK